MQFFLYFLGLEGKAGRVHSLTDPEGSQVVANCGGTLRVDFPGPLPRESVSLPGIFLGPFPTHHHFRTPPCFASHRPWDHFPLHVLSTLTICSWAVESDLCVPCPPPPPATRGQCLPNALLLYFCIDNPLSSNLPFLREAPQVDQRGPQTFPTNHTPPPPCIRYALVQATVGVGTVIIVYVTLITYDM